MTAAEMLRTARQACRLTQRALAHRTGVAQPTITRIETGKADPRFGTLTRLLAECEHRLALEPESGFGVDRTQIRELLKLTPVERLRLLERDVAGLSRLERAARGR